jgi:DNA-binding transcriptional regulator GbsR (MarR family)
MNTIDYIDYQINSLFKTTNERTMLKAFFYRVALNMNVKEVSKELGISRIKVNMLTRSVDSFILRKEGFKKPYLKATKAIEKFVTDKVLERHSKHVRKVSIRIVGNYRLSILTH